MERGHRKYQDGQVLTPCNEKVSLYESWEMLLENKVLLFRNIFHTNFLILLKLQTVIKSHLLMMGASNLAILIFSTCFFHFLHLVSYSP